MVDKLYITYLNLSNSPKNEGTKNYFSNRLDSIMSHCKMMKSQGLVDILLLSEMTECYYDQGETRLSIEKIICTLALILEMKPIYLSDGNYASAALINPSKLRHISTDGPLLNVKVKLVNDDKDTDNIFNFILIDVPKSNDWNPDLIHSIIRHNNGPLIFIGSFYYIHGNTGENIDDGMSERLTDLTSEIGVTFKAFQHDDDSNDDSKDNSNDDSNKKSLKVLINEEFKLLTRDIEIKKLIPQNINGLKLSEHHILVIEIKFLD